jgi:uncharacterized protein
VRNESPTFHRIENAQRFGKRATSSAQGSEAVMTRAFLATAFLVLILIPAASYGASFDCKKAQTKVEKIICTETGISELDDELALAYKNALKDDKRSRSIRQEQKQWLKQRNGCADAVCVKNSYAERLLILMQSANNDESKNADDSDLNTDNNSAVFEVVNDEIANDLNGFCQAMADNLNSMPSWPPAYCERPHNPKFTNLKPVQWRTWTVEEFNKRWHLLAQAVDDSYRKIPARQNDRWTDADTKRWREGIRTKRSVVQETILPEGTITSSFQSRRLLRMRSTSFEEMLRNREELGYKPLAMHNLPDACVLGHFIQLSDDGLTMNTNDSRIGADSSHWQLWLFETGPGAYGLYDQQWGEVAPGFSKGVLTHEASTCKILYTKPKHVQGVKK